MRICQSTKSVDFWSASSVMKSCRSFIGTFQARPRPMKKPVRCCHVSPTFACVRFCVAEIAGAMLPSSPTTRPDPIVAVVAVGDRPDELERGAQGVPRREARPHPPPERAARNVEAVGLAADFIPRGPRELDAPPDLLAADEVEPEIGLPGRDAHRRRRRSAPSPCRERRAPPGCWRNSDHRLIFAPR